MSGLQLPGAFVLPSDTHKAKLFIEKDIVKPGWQWFESRLRREICGTTTKIGAHAGSENDLGCNRTGC